MAYVLHAQGLSVIAYNITDILKESINDTVSVKPFEAATSNADPTKVVSWDQYQIARLQTACLYVWHDTIFRQIPQARHTIKRMHQNMRDFWVLQQSVLGRGFPGHANAVLLLRQLKALRQLLTLPVKVVLRSEARPCQASVALNKLSSLARPSRIQTWGQQSFLFLSCREGSPLCCILA